MLLSVGLSVWYFGAIADVTTEHTRIALSAAGTVWAMKPRIVMVADSSATSGTVSVAQVPAPPVADNGRFHMLVILEGVQTGDDRIFAEGGLTWRDLPLPVMAQDDRTDYHEGAVLIGNIDRIERQGVEIHAWGAYLTHPEDDAVRLITLVKSGELRGVSADIDDVEFEVLFPTTDSNGNPLPDPMAFLFGDEDAATVPTEVIDGVEYEVVPIPQEILRVTEGRVMGATVVPFPAFQEAFIENDTGTLAASGAQVMRDSMVTGAVLTAAATATTPGREASPARFNFPDLPPREWFDVPETPGPMPLTILDSGQVFGHLAVWGECHVGITGECVEPPPSPSNYARFHIGEIPLDDGTRVSVGHLTFGNGGHADMHFNADQARAHYDRTSNCGADVVASDGTFGIWLCGAARPGLTTAQIREMMSSPPSGDWRRFGNALDMVAALCVNVPGFNTPRARVRKEAGLIASLIVSHPAVPQANNLTVRLRQRIAASIGRTPTQRRDALAARVHGGNH